MENIQPSRDTLWKGIIEDMFEDFLHFFYPNDIELFDLDKDFGARMFNYYYRILEKYQKHIGTLAIFTDNQLSSEGIFTFFS